MMASRAAPAAYPFGPPAGDCAPLARGMKPREHRHNVVLQARMRIGSAWTDICIRNISSRGLMAQAGTPPERGAYVEIYKGRQIIVGRVMWSRDRRFGIRTQDRLNIGAIVQEPALHGAGRPAAPGGTGLVERRSDPSRLTQAAIAERLERSRRLSSAVQFGIIIACGAAVACITMAIVAEALGRPLQAIAARLEA